MGFEGGDRLLVFGFGFILGIIGALTHYSISAIGMAFLGSLFPMMALQQLLILFMVFMQFFQRLIVANTVWQTGFIPAFSLALVFLVVGIILGFPVNAMGIFAGFTAATGPVLATMGSALKTGFILRGEGKDLELEQKGRKEQLLVVLFTLMLVILVVFLSYPFYFAQHRVPPIDHVFLATLKAAESVDIMSPWLIGSIIVGILLQRIKGMGILFATGLLLDKAFLGWMIIFGLFLKMFLHKRVERSTVTVFAAGLVSGDVMGSFSTIFRRG